MNAASVSIARTAVRGVDKVMVISAHPDDIEIQCGGVLAKWIREMGVSVHYVICTSGDKGTSCPDISPFQLAQQREEEQLVAARFLGVSRIDFLRHPDGELVNDRAFRDELALLIRYFKPDWILTHDPANLHHIHSDHLAVGFAVIDAVVAARETHFLPAQGIIGLQTHSPSGIYLFKTEHPDCFEDITGYIDLKLQAVSQHKSQVQKNWEVWEEKLLRQAERCGCGIDVKYAEAFRSIVHF